MSGAFVTTRWSVVLAARSEDRERARKVLAELCQTSSYRASDHGEVLGELFFGG